MGLRINNNIQSVNGHRNLQRNDAMAGRSMEKLSSGLRINKAADDAAGLIISEQMRAQIAGLGQAISNSETAVNMVQTAEGALDEMNTLMKKARTLALHAANEGANDQSQLVADQSELDNIVSSVTRIAEQTQFANKKILDGSMSSFRSNDILIGSTQTGNDYASKIKTGDYIRGYHSLLIDTAATRSSLVISGGDDTVITTGGTIAAMVGNEQFVTTFTIAINGRNLTVSSGSTKNDLIANLNAIGKDVGFTATVTGVAISTGALGDIVLTSVNYGSASTLSLSYVSGISGATTIIGTATAGDDMAGSILLNTGAVGAVAGTGATSIAVAQSGSNFTLVSSGNEGYRITLNGPLTNEFITTGAMGVSGYYAGVIDGMSTGATFQVGANVGQTVNVEMASMKAGDLGTGVSSRYTSLASLGGSLVSGDAQVALKVIDKTIGDITSQRGKLGAFQANTLESGLNSLRVSKENLTGAESSIRDVDFADESSQFTKYQILVQASTAMLAQANQLPQNVLKLLG